MLGKSSECSISRSLDWPLSFVTNITPGIIITSHAPVLTALNKSAMKKFKGTFLKQESFGNTEMGKKVKKWSDEEDLALSFKCTECPKRNVPMFQTAPTPSKLALGIKVGCVLKSSGSPLAHRH